MTILNEQKTQITEELINNPFAKNQRRKTQSKQTTTLTVLGAKGSGKTLFMAIIALILHHNNYEFYTNFWMDENITSRKDFSISKLYKNPNVSGIFLDECHNIADQNSNHTSETQLLTALFTQSRKRGQIIILTSLHFYKIAKDLRYLTNVIVYPSLDEVSDTLIVDSWDLETNKTSRTYVPNVSRFFKYYDTYELIVSQRVKSQLSNYLLANEKVKNEISKKLGKEERDMIYNLEVNLKNDRKV